MTGLENIIKQIEADSRSRVDEIKAKADAAVKEIIDNANAEAEEISKSYAKLADSKSKNVLERAKAADESDAKRAVLKKKQELIKTMIDAARDDIKNGDAAEYFEFLESILKKTTKGIGGKIILSEKDMKEMTPSFEAVLKEKNLTAESGSLGHRCGCVVVYGNIEINCTVDAVFDAQAEVVSDSLNAFLFGSEGGV